MKTAISIPDPLFRAAEAAAKRRGWSRSQLYAEALQQLLDAEPADSITARLDALYADDDAGLDEELVSAQRRAVAE